MIYKHFALLQSRLQVSIEWNHAWHDFYRTNELTTPSCEWIYQFCMVISFQHCRCRSQPKEPEHLYSIVIENDCHHLKMVIVLYSNLACLNRWPWQTVHKLNTDFIFWFYHRSANMPTLAQTNSRSYNFLHIFAQLNCSQFYQHWSIIEHTFCE